MAEDDPGMNTPTPPQSAAMEHLRAVLHAISTQGRPGLASYAMMCYALVSEVTPSYPPPPELPGAPTLTEAQAALDEALAAATTPQEMLRLIDGGDMLSGAVTDDEQPPQGDVHARTCY